MGKLCEITGNYWEPSRGGLYQHEHNDHEWVTQKISVIDTYRLFPCLSHQFECVSLSWIDTIFLMQGFICQAYMCFKAYFCSLEEAKLFLSMKHVGTEKIFSIVLYTTMVQVRLLGQRINYFHYCFMLFILFSQERQDPLFVYMVLYNSIIEILD